MSDENITPAEIAAHQSTLDRILAEFARPGLVGKVRQHCGWTDDETGEEFPPIWVAEVRYRDNLDRLRAVTMDLGHGDATDEIWRHEVEMLVE